MAHYAKTVTDSAVAFSSAMVLINRWVDADKAILARGQFLKDGGVFFAKHADRLAVIGSIVTLYISSRELYETYNNKTLLEKADSYLEIAASAVTTVGYILVKGGLEIAFPRLLCPLISAYLIPGLGQLLMIIGAVLIVVQVGLQLFSWWQGREFRSHGAVGYYFWQEFEEIRKKSQRYYDDEFYVSEESAETKNYKALANIYEDSELLGKNTDEGGWGHLSWRGAVPFFTSWRRMGISENKLLEMVEDLSKVPSITIGTPKTSGKDKKTVIKLLSPEVFVKFYLYLEKIKKEKPDLETNFENGDQALTYQAVMNMLEQGIYMPKGETSDVVGYLKEIEDSSSMYIGQGKGSEYITTKYIGWDHEHFKHPLAISE